MSGTTVRVECEGGCGLYVEPADRFCVACADLNHLMELRRLYGADQDRRFRHRLDCGSEILDVVGDAGPAEPRTTGRAAVSAQLDRRGLPTAIGEEPEEVLPAPRPVPGAMDEDDCRFVLPHRRRLSRFRSRREEQGKGKDNSA